MYMWFHRSLWIFSHPWTIWKYIRGESNARVSDVGRWKLLALFYNKTTIKQSRSPEIQRNWPVLCSPIHHQFTKFYENLTITFTVLTRFYCTYIRKNAPQPWRPCFLTGQNHFRTLPRHHLNKCFDLVSWRLHNNCGIKSVNKVLL